MGDDEGGGLIGAGGNILADIDAEKALLGLLIAKPETGEAARDLVTPEDFFDPLHRRMFACFANGRAPGMSDLVSALGGDPKAIVEDGLTVAQYIAALIAGAPAGEVIDTLAMHIHDCAERRATQDEAYPMFPEELKSGFGAILWRDLDMPGAEHEWLIKGLLTRGERSLWAGPSQSGKSFLATDAALAISRGTDFFGMKTRRGLAIYQAGEGGRGLKKRLRAYRQHHGIEPETDLPFVLLTSPVDLYARNGDDTNKLIAEIKMWAKHYDGFPLELVVIDTLSAATPGANENASEDVSVVLARCARIATECDCHVMLVHHMNAAGSKPRGHTSLFANVDNAAEVVKTEAKDADGRPRRVFRITKMKDGEDGKSLSFVLRQVILGTDKDGDNITSCVVTEPAGDAPEQAGDKPQGFKLRDMEQEAFRALVKAINKSGTKAPADKSGIPADALVVKYSEWKREYAAIASFTAEDGNADEALKKRLQRYGRSFLRFGLIGRDNPYLWRTGKPVVGFRSAQVYVPPGDDPEMPWVAGENPEGDGAAEPDVPGDVPEEATENSDGSKQ